MENSKNSFVGGYNNHSEGLYNTAAPYIDPYIPTATSPHIPFINTAYWFPPETQHHCSL